MGSHPLSGGAEVVNEALAKRLVADGHQVTFVVGGYKGGEPEELHADGYRIIRVGNRITVYHKARKYYQRHLRGWADLVIDEVNTIPFFAKFYVREPHLLFVHQLARRIWFYELPPLIGWVGFVIEPLYLRVLAGQAAITVSESTKTDLTRYGFRSADIAVISEGTDTPLFKTLPPLTSKAARPTMLSLGAMRPMKRTLDQIQAFELAKRQLPDLRLDIAGDSSDKYGQQVLAAIAASPYATDITYHGRVSQDEKWRLLRRAHCIVVTSVKEGWGLIVTEANTQATPAVVYDVDGLRDSVRSGITGYVCKQNNPQSLADAVCKLIDDKRNYQQIRQAAWRWSRTITFDQSYQDFKDAISHATTPRIGHRAD